MGFTTLSNYYLTDWWYDTDFCLAILEKEVKIVNKPSKDRNSFFLPKVNFNVTAKTNYSLVSDNSLVVPFPATKIMNINSLSHLKKLIH